MLKKPLFSLTRAVLAAIALSAAANVANATPVFTPFGDPFPTGSTVILSPGFSTTLGFVPSVTLSNFSLLSFVPAGGDQTFTYSADFDNVFLDVPGGTQVGSYHATSTDFTATLSGRSSLFQTGTFNAVLDSATFTGPVSPSGAIVISQLNLLLSQNGTATFTGPVVVGGVTGLLADTSFVINPQYNVNGGPFINLPSLNANSSPPPAAVPEPATAALVIPGLLAMLGVRRRRAAAVA